MTRLGNTTAASLLSFVLVSLLWVSPVDAFTAPHSRVHVPVAERKNHAFSSLTENALEKKNHRTHASSSTNHHAMIGSAIGTAALPSWEAAALTCLLPTFLGYWKREYGVSYAYGGAVSLTALLVYRSLSPSLAAWHAAALVFYGIRLNLFLLYREVFIPSMRKVRDRVEKKAPAKRLERTPLILSCAMLYYGLCAPLFVTSQLDSVVIGKPTSRLLKGLIGIVWGGFLVGAIGDIYKSIVKKKHGKDHLVTSGIYKYLRHPNYTGEVIGWTANALVALVAAICEDGIVSKPTLGLFTLASLFGAAGINFVLAAATKNLEKKQEEKYGNQEEYKDWIKTSWGGFQLKSREEEDHVVPHLELSVEEEEGSGSGI